MNTILMLAAIGIGANDPYQWPSDNIYQWEPKSPYSWPEEHETPIQQSGSIEFRVNGVKQPQNTVKLYYFGAKWCSGCKFGWNYVDEAKKQIPDWDKYIEYIDIDKRKDLADWFKVERIPTWVLVNEPSMNQMGRINPDPNSFDAKQFARLGLSLYNNFFPNEINTRPPSKIIKAKKAVSSTYHREAYYPVRGSWWTGCGSWRHLTVGEHTGKFSPTWLSQLSWAEIQSLHSDDHENRVKWQYVKR